MLITGQAIVLQLTTSFSRPVARLHRSSELLLSLAAPTELSLAAPTELSLACLLLAAHIELSHTSSLKQHSETPPLLCLLSTVHASARV